MVARSKNMPAGIASSVTVAWWASSAMSGQYSSRLGSDGAAMASVTGLPRAPVSSSPKRAPPPGAPSADRRLDPRHAGAAAGPGCSGRRNCNVLLDDLHWDRPDLDCEPQQARGIPRNLQLDETVSEHTDRLWTSTMLSRGLPNEGSSSSSSSSDLPQPP